MNVLGISGRHRDAAAAVCVDGRVVAAASEDYFAKVAAIGYELTGGAPSGAVAACLQRAGLTPAQVDRVAVVADDGETEPRTPAEWSGRWPHASMISVSPLQADAMSAAAASEGCGALFVCSSAPAAAVSFVMDGAAPVARREFEGADGLLAAVRVTVGALGLQAVDPLADLDRLGHAGEPEFNHELTSIIDWAPSGFVVDVPALERLIERHNRDVDGRLADLSSLNVRVHQRRRALAASVTSRLAEILRQALDAASDDAGGGRLACGGDLFAHARLNTELRQLMGDRLVLGPVPSLVGRALGGALEAASPNRQQLTTLALGPAYSDAEIKRVLDNCRLDYVYEPDWSRLIGRASRLLAQGKVVGWFQGPMGFGSTTSGSRSILADPSGRYVRQNMNEYLRNVAVDEPLPVAFAPSEARRCLVGGMPGTAGAFDVTVAPACRDSLGAALDARGCVRVRAGELGPGVEFLELLELHHRRTGTSGLIEIDLASGDEPVACTPRDAVRTMFSSAIDALVVGRFVLMKDYWLLRSQTD